MSISESPGIPAGGRSGVEWAFGGVGRVSSGRGAAGAAMGTVDSTVPGETFGVAGCPAATCGPER